ncbi:dopamine receptor 3 [Plakobranchus ocellatus]|uniref:Dopamine receptor 3 n=1 Tax=Plakobranchus ocellatus TaxID=259542 RepID=A0AAV4C6Y4_9GAST|nr:dopamine receptor 3 [Plakobranchus ocellatus]
MSIMINNSFLNETGKQTQKNLVNASTALPDLFNTVNFDKLRSSFMPNFISEKEPILRVAYLIVLSIATGLGNLLVLVAVLKFPSLRRATNSMLGSLALSDFLVGTVTVPLYIAWTTQPGIFDRSSFMCALVLESCLVVVTASQVSLLLLSVEQYLAVCHPFRHRDLLLGCPRLHALGVALTWTASLFTAAVFLLAFNKDRHVACSYYNVFDEMFLFIASIFGVFVPFAMIIYFNVRVLCVVKESEKRISFAIRGDDQCPILRRRERSDHGSFSISISKTESSSSDQMQKLGFGKGTYHRLEVVSQGEGELPPVTDCDQTDLTNRSLRDKSSPKAEHPITSAVSHDASHDFVETPEDNVFSDNRCVFSLTTEPHYQKRVYCDCNSDQIKDTQIDDEYLLLSVPRLQKDKTILADEKMAPSATDKVLALKCKRCELNIYEREHISVDGRMQLLNKWSGLSDKNCRQRGNEFLHMNRRHSDTTLVAASSRGGFTTQMSKSTSALEAKCSDARSTLSTTHQNMLVHRKSSYEACLVANSLQTLDKSLSQGSALQVLEAKHRQLSGISSPDGYVQISGCKTSKLNTSLDFRQTVSVPCFLKAGSMNEISCIPTLPDTLLNENLSGSKAIEASASCTFCKSCAKDMDSSKRDWSQRKEGPRSTQDIWRIPYNQNNNRITRCISNYLDCHTSVSSDRAKFDLHPAVIKNLRRKHVKGDKYFLESEPHSIHLCAFQNNNNLLQGQDACFAEANSKNSFFYLGEIRDKSFCELRRLRPNTIMSNTSDKGKSFCARYDYTRASDNEYRGNNNIDTSVTGVTFSQCAIAEENKTELPLFVYENEAKVSIDSGISVNVAPVTEHDIVEKMDSGDRDATAETNDTANRRDSSMSKGKRANIVCNEDGVSLRGKKSTGQLTSGSSTSRHLRVKKRSRSLSVTSVGVSRKVQWMVALVCATFILAWFPFFAAMLANVFCDTCALTYFLNAAIMVAFSKSMANPIVYALCHVAFRRAYSKVFSALGFPCC